MKLEVGMYVRTPKGICKIEGFVSTLTDDYIENEKGSLIPKDEITKSSHNIIDLIEVGDYANDCLVEKKFPEVEYAEQSIKLKGSTDYFYDIHIKSIVTKEQFEAMAYKVMN